MLIVFFPDSEPISTGVVISIFSEVSFVPVMKRKNWRKPLFMSEPSIAVPASVSAG